MGLFRNRNKGEAPSRSEQQENYDNSNSSQSQWERMAQQAESERAKRLSSERQQRKIIAAILLGNGDIDQSAIDARDVNVNEDVRQAYLDKVVQGEIGDVQYRELLKHVGDPKLDAPVDSEMNPTAVKAMRATNTFDSAYEWAILRGVMSGQVPNMDNAISPSGSDIDRLMGFYRQYPTPLDFENNSNAFLSAVGASQRSEYASFQRKMESFKLKVYGKKQEYWEQIKELRHEATDFDYRRQKQQERMREQH